MGQSEMGIGEAPGQAGSFKGIPPGGLVLKKKVYPKKDPSRLTMKKNWKSSFKKFSTKRGK